MPRRNILTESQRKALLDLPTDKISLLHYYTLAEDDLEIIRDRRRPHNKFGFALQLCALRYPGRLLALGEGASQELTSFLAVQLGLKSADLVGYATREETRREHIGILRDLYGYEMFSGQSAKDLKAWLRDEAKLARSNEDLARRFVDECRRTMTILPGISVIERLCADALVEAERQTESLIANRLDPMTQDKLNAMLSEEISARASRFIWLRQFEVGENSADWVGTYLTYRRI